MIIHFILYLCIFSVHALALSQEFLEYSLNTQADITALTYCENRLYAGVSDGNIEVFDLNQRQKIHNIALKPIIYADQNQEMPPKIFSLDCMNHQILITAEGNQGYRDLWIYTPQTGLQMIWQNSQVHKVQWVQKHLILTATLGNEINLYDIANKRSIYSIRPSNANFSDFSVKQDKSLAALTSESGVIDILDIQNGVLLDRFHNIHKDKVYQLYFIHDVIVSGGQDKRVGIIHYNTRLEQQKKSDFLVYSVELSPNAQKGAYLSSENNTINIFNTTTLENELTLTTDQSLTQYIIFIDENHLISSGDNDQILIWNIQKGAL